MTAAVAAFALANAAQSNPIGPNYFAGAGDHLRYAEHCEDATLDADARIGYCIGMVKDGRGGSDQAYAELATLYAAKHDYERALEYAARPFDNLSSASTVGHSSDYTEIPLLEERSEIYAEAGKYAEAMADVAVIFEISPNKAGSYNHRCWIRAIAGQELDLALDDCNKSLELHPNDAATLDSRGLANYKAGHLQDALADYGAAVSKDSNFADALYMRGIV
ncbi:MAG TPA: hypothetical protein VIJ85_13835 [Rhizomicrobium sp.]